MKTAPVIHVAVRPDEARRALSETLARTFPSCEVHSGPDQPEPGAIVISTPDECGIDACRELVGLGAQVVILAPVPRTREHEAYARAGAVAYLPMDLDLGDLVRAIQASIPGMKPS
jgi:DNA-binding NarL/FixJ family response regulator